ncbi:MAG TPA: DinB family protein [Streptosporangiaceae bacterium]
MTTAELLADALSRVREVVHQVASGLTADQLAYRPQPGANSVGWLLWHLTRVQDDHLSEVAGTEQAWAADGWADRFGLPYETAATGWSQESEEVGQFSVGSADLLTGYYDAVHERSLAFVAGLTDADLDKVVDERWDPPVTLGVRLVSVIDDDAQHAGQAAYLRGLILG